jgi:hypothetical protein
VKLLSAVDQKTFGGDSPYRWLQLTFTALRLSFSCCRPNSPICSSLLFMQLVLSFILN